MTLTEFLTARLDEDALWAREASRHDDEPLVEGGEHWQWVCPGDDVVISLDPGQEYAEHEDHLSASLRSSEEYPYRSIPGTGPSIRISSEEVLTTTAGHIARHDPARVLAEVAAKRRIMEQAKEATSDRLTVMSQFSASREEDELFRASDPGRLILLALASVYADHPEFDPSWSS